MGIRLFAIFLGALIMDGIIFPTFFGFKESFLSLLILIMPILYLGPAKQYLVSGTLFSFILELLKGLNFGALIIPFLFTVFLIFVVQKFLDIKHTHNTRFNIISAVMLAAISTIFVYTFFIFYNYGSINKEYIDLKISLTIFIETLALIAVFNFIFNKKDDYV